MLKVKVGAEATNAHHTMDGDNMAGLAALNFGTPDFMNPFETLTGSALNEEAIWYFFLYLHPSEDVRQGAFAALRRYKGIKLLKSAYDIMTGEAQMKALRARMILNIAAYINQNPNLTPAQTRRFVQDELINFIRSAKYVLGE
eukprot:Clim_evm53s207 gene=Clim_evmTU53s207